MRNANCIYGRRFEGVSVDYIAGQYREVLWDDMEGSLGWLGMLITCGKCYSRTFRVVDVAGSAYITSTLALGNVVCA